jgi:hypothetical protein
MAAELPRPGVEVVQVIRTTTPSVVTPTLVPCVVGVARQIVDLLVDDGSGSKTLNGDALISLPAFFLAAAATGTPAVYSGLDGLHLIFSVNNGVNVDVLFADPTTVGLTPTAVITAINAALSSAGITSAIAELIGTTRFRLRTLATGQYQSILIDAGTSPAVCTAFGIGPGRSYDGVDNYNQLEESIPSINLPDPRGNLDELVIEPTSIRAFLAMSASNFVEVLRTEAFLRNGSVDNPAVLTGTIDLTTLNLTLGADVAGKTLIISVDGAANQTVSFTTSETSIALLLAKIDAGTTGIVPTEDPTTHHLVLTDVTTGAAATLTMGAGTANTTLGFTTGQTSTGASIAVIDDGNGDNFSPLMQFAGVDFTAVGNAAVVQGSVDLTTLTYPGDIQGKTLIISDGQQLQTLTFPTPTADSAAIIAHINEVMGASAGGRLVATVDGTSHKLVLTSTNTGADAFIWVQGGTSLTTLGLTANTQVHGALGHAVAGDELIVDGISAGIIVAVAPGGHKDTLKLNNQKALTSDFGNHWYITAKNLTGTGVDRPTPNLVVDANVTTTLKNSLWRDTNGVPVSPTAARAPVYLSYTAIRKDVSASAKNASLLRFDNQTQIESTIPPISTANPLGLGMFFASVNAPGVQITGLGVDGVSADEPFGTVEAFNKAAEFLEAFEVYALAPLTHSPEVGQLFNTHVNFMSEPTEKGERIVLFNSEQPTNALDTLVGSGANGNSVGTTGLQFDTGIPNLSALLLNKGVNPVGTISIQSGVFLDIASDAKNYSISGVNGSIVTIRTTFTPGTNDDSFYSTTALNAPPLPSQLIQEAFAVRIRGAALVTADGSPDKNAIAAAYSAVSQSYGNRRFWHTMPDQCAATIGGVEQVLEGFYMNAGIVGMIGQQPPQQSFTNFPMAGYSRVIGSTNYFSERQMNVMAAGGTYIIVQDAPSAPLIARMALTTDMTSVETRTDSITKVVDFTAKFLRRGLKNFIGRFNITQAFLDQLGTVVGGLGGYLTEVGVLVGFNLNNIIQDEQAPDTVLIDVLIDPPFPCNYIRITLVI